MLVIAPRGSLAHNYQRNCDGGLVLSTITFAILWVYLLATITRAITGKGNCWQQLPQQLPTRVIVGATITPTITPTITRLVVRILRREQESHAG